MARASLVFRLLFPCRPQVLPQPFCRLVNIRVHDCSHFLRRIPFCNFSLLPFHTSTISPVVVFVNQKPGAWPIRSQAAYVTKVNATEEGSVASRLEGALGVAAHLEVVADRLLCA